MSPLAEDICAARHGGSAESRAAFAAIAAVLSVARGRVLLVIAESGPNGCTAKEAADKLGVPLNTISGRFSELRKLRLIQKTGTRREGSAVHITPAND